MYSVCGLLALLLFCGACTAQSVSFSDSRVQYIGRTYQSSSGAVLSWYVVIHHATITREEQQKKKRNKKEKDANMCKGPA
jgi:hypothetical protein